MLYTFLLVVHAMLAAALVTIILMQRSEGGGLGVGGSPSGLMSARGAADFLTRGTGILATLFVLMSIGLAALATVERSPREIDTSLARTAPAAPASDVPLADPLAPGATGVPIPADVTAPVPAAPAAAPVTQPTAAPAADREQRRSEPQPERSAPRAERSTPSQPKAPAPATKAPSTSSETKASSESGGNSSVPLVLPPRPAVPAPSAAPAEAPALSAE